MNKKTLIKMMSFLLILFTTGCSSDDDGFSDVDGQIPSIDLTSTHIQSEAGRSFTIAGTVKDNDGIKSIRLQNAELDLDKTIDLLTIYDELLYSYELSYSFKTQTALTSESFTILVTVTDVGGRTVQSEILVTMDGDFTNPIFTTVPDVNITVLIKDETKLNLRFSASDNKALSYAKVSIPSLDYEKQIEINGKEYSYSDVIALPSTIASYDMTITVADKFDLSATQNCKINVSEMPDFPKMYLTDVTDASKMNSDLFGIPMLIEHTGEYNYKARYYSEAAGTQIRFVPQKTDFEPICFGINPNDNTSLTDEPDLSQPIVLDEKGYYEITFNTKSGIYTVNKYTPTDEPLPIGETVLLDPAQESTTTFQLALAGSGLPGVGNWSTSDPLILTQDSENKYLFYAEMNLTAGTEIEFTITPRHDWGWWPEPYFRFENGEYDSMENEYNTKNSGNNMTKVTVQKDGKYMFKFDSHLLRSRFYPIN